MYDTILNCNIKIAFELIIGRRKKIMICLVTSGKEEEKKRRWKANA
jgi:hypothetical protein